MALKIRIPEPGEERLTWQKGVEFEICTDEGKQKGLLDLQWALLDVDQLAHRFDELREDPTASREFVGDRLRAVRGLKDEQGEDWPAEEQLRFVAKSPETMLTALDAFIDHIRGARKNSSKPSDEPSTTRRGTKH